MAKLDNNKKILVILVVFALILIIAVSYMQVTGFFIFRPFNYFNYVQRSTTVGGPGGAMGGPGGALGGLGYLIK